MVDKLFPTIIQIKVDQQNGSYYKGACVSDADYQAAFQKMISASKHLTQLFLKQNPSDEDRELFDRYLDELDQEAHCEMLSLESDYSYVEGFVTASKLFQEVNKSNELFK